MGLSVLRTIPQQPRRFKRLPDRRAEVGRRSRRSRRARYDHQIHPGANLAADLAHGLPQPASQPVPHHRASDASTDSQSQANPTVLIKARIEHQKRCRATESFAIGAAEVVLLREPPEQACGCHPLPGNGQPVPPLGATAFQRTPASGRAHSGPKPVHPLARALLGLIGTFHPTSSSARPTITQPPEPSNGRTRSGVALTPLASPPYPAVSSLWATRRFVHILRRHRAVASSRTTRPRISVAQVIPRRSAAIHRVLHTCG